MDMSYMYGAQRPQRDVTPIIDVCTTVVYQHSRMVWCATHTGSAGGSEKAREREGGEGRGGERRKVRNGEREAGIMAMAVLM